MIGLLQKWLTRQIDLVTPHGDRIERFELWLTSPGSRIDNWRVSSDDPPDASDLGNDIYEVILNDHKSRQGGSDSQKYVVLAWLGGDASSHESSHSVTIDTPQLADRDSQFDEEFAPTKTGVLRQLMSHNERSARIASGVSDRMLMALTRQVEELSGENKTLRSELREVQTMREELHNQKMERDLRYANEAVMLEEKQHMMATIRTLIPVAAAKMLPGSSAGGSLPGTLAAQNFMKSLSEPELIGMMEKLTPENRAGFMGLIDVFAKGEPPRTAAETMTADLAEQATRNTGAH